MEAIEIDKKQNLIPFFVSIILVTKFNKNRIVIDYVQFAKRTEFCFLFFPITVYYNISRKPYNIVII